MIRPPSPSLISSTPFPYVAPPFTYSLIFVNLPPGSLFNQLFALDPKTRLFARATSSSCAIFSFCRKTSGFLPPLSCPRSHSSGTGEDRPPICGLIVLFICSFLMWFHFCNMCGVHATFWVICPPHPWGRLHPSPSPGSIGDPVSLFQFPTPTQPFILLR